MTTDDLSLNNLKYFTYWDRVKEQCPNLRLIAFTIAFGIDKSQEFKEWFEKHKDWVEIGVHGYDHTYPPECERYNQEELIKKSLDILRPFLKKKFLYRAPGFQVTCKTEGILKKLGFVGIAHQLRIKYFDGRFEMPFNTHCCNKYYNPITKIWKDLAL